MRMVGREYLDNVPLFQGCSEKMLDSISVLLREIQALFLPIIVLYPHKINSFSVHQFAPEEYLYRAGETANEMFFVVSGSVDELSENAEVFYYRDMSIFPVEFKLNKMSSALEGRRYAARQS
jgi:CRP-like cAMP-binding protein